MLLRIYSLSEILIEIASGLLVILSFMYCYKKYNPFYMRLLPTYAIINELTNICNLVYRSFVNLSVHLFTLFELLYFSYFVYQIIRHKANKRLLLSLTSAFVLFYFYALLKLDVLKGTYFFVLLESIILSVGCITYFMELISGVAFIELKREPAFWMAFGIFFYFVLLIPTLIISGYYLYSGTEDISTAFYSLNNYAQVGSYFLFYKAMTCRRPKSY